jgi:hypothetical protein
MIFNQFDEFGNHLWHYDITGHAMKEVLRKELRPGETLRGSVFTTGSAGTIGAGDYLREIFPYSKLAASEALQCPTLLINSFGAHRIEGIGDKHVPWIHNVRNTDMVMAMDDEAPMQHIRLFNEPEGKKYLAQRGVPETLTEQLHLLGISGVANLLSAIKMVKWYEWGEGDAVITVLTDSMEMYASRLRELTAEPGEFTAHDGAVAYHQHLMGQGKDNMEELTIGVFKPESKQKLLHIMRRHNVDGVILGCTELPLILRQEDTKIRLLDTMALHAEAALKYALSS